MSSHKEIETQEYKGHTIHANGHGYRILKDDLILASRTQESCGDTDTMFQCAKLLIDEPAPVAVDDH